MNINLLYSKKRTLLLYSLEINLTISLPHLWKNNSHIKTCIFNPKFIKTAFLNALF